MKTKNALIVVLVGLVVLAVTAIALCFALRRNIAHENLDGFSRNLEKLASDESWNAKGLSKILADISAQVTTTTNLVLQSQMMESYVKTLCDVEFPKKLFANRPGPVIGWYAGVRLECGYFEIYKNRSSAYDKPWMRPKADYAVDLLLRGWKRIMELSRQVDEIVAFSIEKESSSTSRPMLVKSEVAGCMEENAKKLEDLLETYVLIPSMKNEFMPGGFERAVRLFEEVVGRPPRIKRDGK